jgi:acyl carrier protein
MKMSTLDREKVKEFIIEYLSRKNAEMISLEDSINDDFDFFQAGIIDSMGLLEMINAMEDRFSINVDFEQMDPNLFTILGPFCHYVSENAAKNDEV